MTGIKKVALYIVLSIITVVSLCCAIFFAVNENDGKIAYAESSGGLTLVTTSAEATSGSEFSVNLYVEENSNLAGCTFTLAFDSSLVSIVKDKCTMGDAGATVNITEYNVTVSYARAVSTNAKLDFATLVFKVNDGIAFDSYNSWLSLSGDKEFYDDSFNDIAMTYSASVLTISAVNVGDVYNDGEVNSKDAIYLLQYLANMDSAKDINLTNANTYVEDNSDNGTIKINGKDAIMLLQYLAKMDVTMGVGEWFVQVAPTESSTGALVRKTAAGIETATLPALNQSDYVYTLVSPTCAAAGKTTYSYSKDGQYFVFTVALEKLAHTVVTDEAASATCTENGLTAGSHCSVCGEVLVAQTVIPATGHTVYVSKEGVSSTCTTAGLTEEHKCSVCNCIVQEQTVISATGHTDSNNDYICETCDEWVLDESEYTKISSIADLENILSDLNGIYKLTCDLDLSSYSWNPIGSTTLPFTGYLYGDGYVISGLNFSSTDNCALFISNAGIIANLTINNFTCTVQGDGNFGGFAVYNSGSILNCSITGTSTFKVSQGVSGSMSAYSGNLGAFSWSHSLGGICAENTGTIEGCSVTGTFSIAISCSSQMTANVFAGSTSYWMSCTINVNFGCITGVNNGNISNCSVSATPTASVTAYAYSSKGKSDAIVNAYLGALVGVNKGTVENSESKKLTTTPSESTVEATGSSWSATTLNIYEDATYKGLFGSNTGTLSKVTFLS